MEKSSIWIIVRAIMFSKDHTNDNRGLRRKEVEFEWTDECQYAFDEIKRQLTSRPTLAHFDINARTIVSTDASGVALGAVLSQVQRGE